MDGDDVIRMFSSNDDPESIDPSSLRHPTYWIRPPQRLSIEPGHHRFIWDLRHEPPAGTQREFSISAVHLRTPASPHGPFAHPGTYTVRLTVDGSVLERPIEVRLDPRVTMSEEDVRLQTDNSLVCYRGYLELLVIREAIDAELHGLDAASSFRMDRSP